MNHKTASKLNTIYQEANVPHIYWRDGLEIVFFSTLAAIRSFAVSKKSLMTDQN